jgi:hypothetical protein
MTAFCDWVAVISFFIALILALTGDSGRMRWAAFVALGLLAWAVPVALTASHVAHG